MLEFIRHLFLPHQTNNHRPKILHIDALFVYVLFFILFQLVTKTIHTQAPMVLGYATDIYAEQLLVLTNAQRAAAGLTPLSMNSQLSQAAAAKAQDMFAKNYWSHTSPDGLTPWQFITNSGYKYSVAGENLAKNFSNSQGVVDAWMASQTHKDNILKPNYKEVGFAIVNGNLNGEETTLVVQMFGATSGSTAISYVSPTQPPQQSLTQSPKQPAGNTVNQPKTTIEPVPTVQVDTAGITKTSPEKPLASDELLAPKTIFAAQPEFNRVSIKPVIDIRSLTKTVSLIFLITMVLVLLIDAFIVYRKKVIRVTGHNLAHILFISAIIIVLTVSISGSIL